MPAKILRMIAVAAACFCDSAIAVAAGPPRHAPTPVDGSPGYSRPDAPKATRRAKQNAVRAQAADHGRYVDPAAPYKANRLSLPRATEPMDYVEVTNDDLDKFHEAFQHAFIEALSRNAWRERGEHCRFASCKATCPLWTGPVIEMSVLDPKRAALEASLQPVEATEYGDYMSNALSMAELAETWAGEIRKQGHLYLEDGGYIPHWKLVPKRGLRKWASEDDVVADLMKIGAVQGDMFSLPELRSVAQVEKLLKAKGIALPEDLWMLVSSGTTIARSDDPRPESTHGMVIENMRKALKRL